PLPPPQQGAGLPRHLAGDQGEDRRRARRPLPHRKPQGEAEQGDGALMPINESDVAAPVSRPALPVAGQPLVAKDYKGTLPPVWCPGCGDFAVLASMQKAMADLGIPPHELVFVS